MEFLYATKTHFDWLKHHDTHIAPERLLQKIRAQQILMVTIEKAPIGWLRFGLFWDSIPFMNLLFLVSNFRKKGIGRQLVQFWESEMQKQQYKMVLTSTQSDETAQHFYRKIGYKESGSLILENEPLEIFFIKSIEAV